MLEYAALSAAAERGDGLSDPDRVHIEKDLARSQVACLEGLVGTEQKEEHMAAVGRVLRAWCVLRPDVGYVQGMNFAAAVLLALLASDEADAFAVFHALLMRLPADFFSKSPSLTRPESCNSWLRAKSRCNFFSRA